jgi:phosphoenolpyruvate carboxykinase (ATP)
MVRHPYAYGEMLKARLMKQGATCWLVNTGWTGGPFGVGKRISIRHTRALLHAALTAKLNAVAFRTDSVFGFEVPVEFEGVPQQILDPASSWGSREEYDRKYQALAARFIENFKLIKAGCPESVAQAGPS